MENVVDVDVPSVSVLPAQGPFNSLQQSIIEADNSIEGEGRHPWQQA